uniref:Uncharacterized protein n=1 Tax=Salix viminalis TaxID=40686 RepID=A0A6N2ML03_SALVM
MIAFAASTRFGGAFGEVVGNHIPSTDSKELVGGIEMPLFAMEPMQMEKLLWIWGVGGSQARNSSLVGALVLPSHMDHPVLYRYQSVDKRVNIWKMPCILNFWRANAPGRRLKILDGLTIVFFLPAVSSNYSLKGK